MKKTTITILFISLYILSFSQEKEWINKNYLGFYVGGIQSSIHLLYQDENRTLGVANPSFTSISAGISYKNFSEQFWILRLGTSIDLKYMQKGGYLDFSQDLDSSANVMRLYKHVPSYIELATLMNLSFGKRWYHFNILAGPHIAYIVNEELFSMTADASSLEKQGADNKAEFGLDIGGGVDFQLGRSNVELRLMYSLGFTDNFNSEEINANLWNNQNRVVAGMLYYYYKL